MVTEGILEILRILSVVTGTRAVLVELQKVLSQRTSLCLSVSTDVHPDSHSDRVHVSQRVRLSRDALHAEGLRHHFPPRRERPEEKEELQGLNTTLLSVFTLSVAALSVAVLPFLIVAVCLCCRLLSRLPDCPKDQMRNKTERQRLNLTDRSNTAVILQIIGAETTHYTVFTLYLSL